MEEEKKRKKLRGWQIVLIVMGTLMEFLGLLASIENKDPEMFLAWTFMLGFLGGIAWTIVNAVKRRKVAKPLIVTAVCFCAFIAAALLMAQKTIEDRDARISTLTVQNQIMAPKADYFDTIVDRNLLTNFRETAKELGAPPKAFVSFLLDKKYIYRDKRGKLLPYENKNDGLFEVKECVNPKTSWSGTQTFVTPKGRETFRLLYVGA